MPRGTPEGARRAGALGGGGKAMGGGRGVVRSASRESSKMTKKNERAGSKQTLSSTVPYGNQMVKAAVKSGNTRMSGLTSPSVSPRMSKAPVKPSKSVSKRQAKFK